jgi:hypothetical protein
LRAGLRRSDGGRSLGNIVVGAMAIRTGHVLVGMERCPPLGDMLRHELFLMAFQARLGGLGRLESLDVDDLSDLLTAAADVLTRWPVTLLALELPVNILVLE